MKAINRFEATMARCQALVHLGTQGHGNEDCLRMAIVLAVSALEWYAKDRFLESLARHCRNTGGKFNEALEKQLEKAGIATDFWRRKAMDKQPKPLKTVRNKMARHVRSFTVQTAKSVDELFSCYGIGNITMHAEKKAGLTTVKASIKRMIRRRHEIAHASDYLISGKLQAVDCEDVKLRLDRVERFVQAMEDILVAKFSARRARRPRR